MNTALLFNLFEFRTGVWLPKAYFVGRDAAGRPKEVLQTARESMLSLYELVPDAPLRRAFELTEALRDKAVAEHFNRSSRNRTTLAGLVAPAARDREDVLRYINVRMSELLEICRRQGYYLTANLDTRSSPTPHLLTFLPEDWQPKLSFELTGAGLDYRLRVVTPGGSITAVRYLDPRIVTNRPAPGWVLAGNRLGRIAGLPGDVLRPFLTKDTLHVPLAEVGRYLREFVVRAARRVPIEVSGFDYQECPAPTELILSAEPHAFTEIYFLQAAFRYGDHTFRFGDPESVAVDYRDRPPYSLTRIVRDPEAERAMLAPLLELGLRTGGERKSLSATEAPERYENLAWLLENRERVEQLQVQIKEPEEDGRAFATARGEIRVAAADRGDWLDVRGAVEAAGHQLPFSRLVDHLRRGDPRFPLPDGRWFLIPTSWFARYAPGLSFARIQGASVRLARSHAPLLTAMGVDDPHGAGPGLDLATAYLPGKGLRAELRPYQLEGARWLVGHYHDKLGACLADDMGLGKTLQTIAVLVYAKEQLADRVVESAPPADLFSAPAPDEDFLRPLRALIVLPASLVYNWMTELEKFAPGLSVLANVGSKRVREARVLRRYDVILTTYQTALRDEKILAGTDLEYIILDESQQIKNRKSKVFRALNGLAARHRVSLSGTPIENSLSDLWSQMQFINPGLLGSFSFFRRHFIQPVEQHDDEAKKQQLRELVAPYLLRRTKEEVAPDLPELDTQVFYCEMTPAQARRYERERSAARNALLGIGAGDGGGDYKLRVIQALTRLRQIANHPGISDPDYQKSSGKFDEVSEQLDTLRRAGRKVLVFSSMVKHLERYRDRLRAAGHPYAWITGSVPADGRAHEVRRFQEDPAVQIFFISIRAGGTGLNLTAADYVFLLDPWWNPTVEDQAIARAHRIGRKANVFARKFLTKGSLEEKIHLLQRRKKRLASEIIGNGEGWDLDRGEIDYLLG